MPQLNCPHCAQPYDITPDQWPQYQNRHINCTRCNQPFMVTGHAGAPVATPLPAAPPAPAAAAGGPYGAAGYAPPGGYYPPPPAKSGMSGLVIGIVVAAVLVVGIGIVALLISILLPSLNRAREQANRVKCMNNMRQVALACTLYANSDRRGQFPPTINDVLLTQPVEPNVFVCPSSHDEPVSGGSLEANAAQLTAGGHLSYVYLGGKLTTRVPNQDKTVLLYEPLAVHRDGCNFAFVDGHVEFFKKTDAERIIRDLERGVNPPGGIPAN